MFHFSLAYWTIPKSKYDSWTSPTLIEDGGNTDEVEYVATRLKKRSRIAKRALVQIIIFLPAEWKVWAKVPP